MQVTKTGRTAQNSESGSITDIRVSCFLLSSKAESFLKAKYIELMEPRQQQLCPSFFCRVPFAYCEPSAMKVPHSVANFLSCNPFPYIFCLPTIRYLKQNLCWAHLREAHKDKNGRTKWARQQRFLPGSVLDSAGRYESLSGWLVTSSIFSHTSWPFVYLLCRNVCWKPFPSFFNQMIFFFFFFLGIECRHSLCILAINPFSDNMACYYLFATIQKEIWFLYTNL